METMTASQNSSDDRRFEQVDRRFDRLERRMENGFRDLRGEMSDQRGEMSDQRGETNGLRGEMKAGFDRIDTRLDAFQRTMILFCGGIVAGLLGLIASQL
jgi:hypothetical protein